MSESPYKNPLDHYKKIVLDENSVDPDPFRQFSAWFHDALASGIAEPEAMFLATATAEGIPSGRMVLLKGFDANGFVFFTNYQSRKGSEIELNPFVAVAFHWKEIERQVRITGKAQRVSESESDEYFASRPLDSRISAIVSSQSKVIHGRKTLVEEFDEVKRNSGPVPKRPAHWGGYRIIPSSFEFWQSGPSRLHDRIQYRMVNGGWVIERLAP
jgi:pyridoxamine 5'-phosphate oxidase